MRLPVPLAEPSRDRLDRHLPPLSIVAGYTPNRLASWSTVALPDSSSSTARVRSSLLRRPGRPRVAPDRVLRFATLRSVGLSVFFLVPFVVVLVSYPKGLLHSSRVN